MSHSNNIKHYLFFISQDYSFSILRPLQEEIIRRGDIVKWFLYGEEINYTLLNEKEECLYDIESIIHFKPDAVFVPGNVVPSFIPGLKVQIFHGLPGEKRTKKGQIYHYIIRGMFDLYCTQGPSSTKIFKRLAQDYGFFHVCETGWSKLDPLFLSKKNLTPHTKSIFFASTFTPRYSKATILYPFILNMIEKYDYHWYITLHPKMNKKIVEKYTSIKSSKVTFVSPVETIEYFQQSDIMLCDISSIIYEYLTQLKPVVTFQSKQNSKALINVTNLEALEKTLINLLKYSSNEIVEIIKKEVNLYHPYTDGKSKLRVLNCVEEILNGKHKPLKKKPLNIWRNFKLRKALNYWKL